MKSAEIGQGHANLVLFDVRAETHVGHNVRLNKYVRYVCFETQPFLPPSRLKPSSIKVKSCFILKMAVL